MSTDDVIEVSPGPLSGAGRRRRLAVGLVVAALAVTGGVVAWTASRGGGSGGAGAGSDPLTCPATIPNPDRQTLDLQPPVPALPTASGVDGRLVPARAPSAIVLCAYQPPVYGSTGVSGGTTTGGGIAGVESPSTLPTSSASDVASDLPLPDVAPVETTIALSGSGTAAGGDHAVGPLVTALQGATVWRDGEEGSCAAVQYPQSVQYLVGLTYDDGIVWVATQDACPGSTNGVARGGPSMTADVTAALAALPTASVSSGAVTGAPAPGTVEPAPGTVAPGTPGSGSEPGDPGSASPYPASSPMPDPFAACRGEDFGSAPTADSPLVPFTPTAVVVCHAPIDGTNTVDKATADVAAPLAAAIDALPTIAPDTACPAIGGETWELLFTDDAGAQASVAVDAGGCGTVGNGVRTVQAGDDFFARMGDLG